MDNGATMHLAVSLFAGAADASSGPEFSRLIGLVQKAEAAGLDMVLLADSAPASGSDAANRQMAFEATTLLSALSTVTSRIGLVAAASTIAHQPYNLARRFASLDIISHGRAGWNATMVQSPREAANFSRPEGFSPDDFRRHTGSISASSKACGRAGTRTRCCSTRAAAASTIPERCICSTTGASSFPCADR